MKRPLRIGPDRPEACPTLGYSTGEGWGWTLATSSRGRGRIYIVEVGVNGLGAARLLAGPLSPLKPAPIARCSRSPGARLIDRLCVVLATGLGISYIALPAAAGRKWTGSGFMGSIEGIL